MRRTKILFMMICCAMLLSFAPVNSEVEPDGIPGETINIAGFRQSHNK